MAPKKKTTTTTTTTSSAPATSKQASAPRSPVPFFGLGVLSIAIALYVHNKGIWWNPYLDKTILSSRSSAQLKADLSLPKSWPGTDVFEKYAPEPWRFLLVLILFFQDALGSRSGQALLIVLTSSIMPIVSFGITEAIKDGRHRLLSVSLIIFVTFLGQLMMVGAATPLVLVPIYAYTRYVENTSVVHPLPSPPAWKMAISQVCSTLTVATIPLTSFTPLHTELFVINNIIFQFYPFLWIPLVFLPNSKTAVSKPGSASAREKPRLDASSLYRTISFVSVAAYYFGLWWGGKDLFLQTKNGLSFGTGGPYLLFWDMLGIFASLYLIVLVDSFADEAKVAQGAQRVHHRRLLLEDIILGAPAVLLLGPGWAASRYFQRREILAEKIRFGQKTV